MKKIRYISLFLLIIILMAHAGCMSTTSPARGGLSGSVTDSSGTPLSGVKVSTADSSTMSDVYGHWAIESLTPQVTEVVATRENYQSQRKTVEVLSGETVENIDFALPADSEIYDIQIAALTSTRARVVFYTKFAARAHVRYGANALMDKTSVADAEELFLHQFDLNDLAPATTYRLKCVATDKFGRMLESEIVSFNTSITARGEPPAGLQLTKVANSVAIQLSWNPDAAADFAGFYLYRAQSAQGPFSRVGSGVINQNGYTDLNVIAGVKYYYRVTRLSGSGDESSPSTTASFLMPGVMTENAVWTAQESPYLLTGDLTIAANASLIIDKGVTIGISRGDQWDADDATDLIDIKVQGTLMVQGTAALPVTMTSAASAPQAGDWNGITFENTADLNAGLIKGLQISFAENGINGVAGVPEIRESGFYSCRLAGVKCGAARRDVALRDLIIDTCATGVSVEDCNVKVQILDSNVTRCIYGIVCRDNKLAEIERNHISLAGVEGIDVGNVETASKVRYNIIGYGSNGVGIVCRGNDEIRRNTIHANVGIEIMETARPFIRSNLILADKDRNGVGLMFTSAIPYNPSTATNTLYIQNNGVWNVTGSRKYVNSDGTVLNGPSADLNFTDLAGPALQGGNPFDGIPALTFSYVPSSGSPVKGAGYDYETVGAEDVPD